MFIRSYLLQLCPMFVTSQLNCLTKYENNSSKISLWKKSEWKFNCHIMIFYNCHHTNTGRKKRQVGYGYCEPPSFLDRFLLNVRCLTPRLKARFARTASPAHYGKKNEIV